jgi:hypothetical protein
VPVSQKKIRLLLRQVLLLLPWFQRQMLRNQIRLWQLVRVLPPYLALVSRNQMRVPQLELVLPWFQRQMLQNQSHHQM